VKFFIFGFVIFSVIFDVSVTARSADLNGEWVLKVEDLNNQSIADLTVKFTNEKAESCLGENWLHVDVLSATTKDDKFFPVSDRLSYTIEGNTLTIGRNEICDAYLHLTGTLDNNEVRGDYYSFGWGHKSLGTFSLAKKK